MSDANELATVSLETLAHYETNRANIVSQVVVRALQRQAEVVQHGAKAGELITAGLNYTTQALGVAMQMHDTLMLKEQLIWANDRLPHDSVEPKHILARFHILADVIREYLVPADALVVNAYLGYMIALQEEFVQSAAHPN